MDIDGTSFKHTLLIELKPPIIIKPHKIAHIKPTKDGDVLKEFFNELLIELDWVVHPTPYEARIVQKQNIIASDLLCNPFSNTYIGPP